MSDAWLFRAYGVDPDTLQPIKRGGPRPDVYARQLRAITSPRPTSLEQSEGPDLAMTLPGGPSRDERGEGFADPEPSPLVEVAATKGGTVR